MKSAAGSDVWGIFCMDQQQHTLEPQYGTNGLWNQFPLVFRDYGPPNSGTYGRIQSFLGLQPPHAACRCDRRFAFSSLCLQAGC